MTLLNRSHLCQSKGSLSVLIYKFAAVQASGGVPANWRSYPVVHCAHRQTPALRLVHGPLRSGLRVHLLPLHHLLRRRRDSRGRVDYWIKKVSCNKKWPHCSCDISTTLTTVQSLLKRWPNDLFLLHDILPSSCNIWQLSNWSILVQTFQYKNNSTCFIKQVLSNSHWVAQSVFSARQHYA